MVAGALIGAAGSLLGGIFGKPKRVSAQKASREAILGQAEGARYAGEKFGFNPLTLLGVSSAVGPSESSNYMGNAIANSAMLLADGLARREEKFGREAALTKQNEELKLQVRELTLRPKFGGIYAQRQAVPSLGAALGRSGDDGGTGTRALGSRETGAASSANSGSRSLAHHGRDRAGDDRRGPDGYPGLRPFTDTLPIDPRREVDPTKIEPHPGFIAIDNPHTSSVVYWPTADGDEGMGIDELLASPFILAGNYGFGKGYAWGTEQETRKAKARGQPIYTVGGKRYQQAGPTHKDRQDRLMQKIGSKPRSRTTDYERRHRTRRGAQ